jgi:hypothetical protein
LISVNFKTEIMEPQRSRALPAIIELKKPKDQGPRMIMAQVPEVTLSLVHVTPIVDMEAEQKFDSSLAHTMA